MWVYQKSYFNEHKLVSVSSANFLHIAYFAGYNQLEMKVAVIVSVAVLALAAAVPVVEKRGRGTNAITLASSLIPVAYDYLKGKLVIIYKKLAEGSPRIVRGIELA